MKKNFFGFPQNVFIFSLVSLLNDIAGETTRRLIPLFLLNILGVKTTIIGFIEGIGEATPHLVEPVSGYFSDKIGRRKIFVVFGQLLRTLMVFLVFSVSWPQVLLIRFLDRSGKGISDGPRDALVSKSSLDCNRGRSFGLGRAMDNLGATIGVVLVLFLLLLLGSPKVFNRQIFQLLVLAIVVPSLIFAFLLLIFAISEKKDKKEKSHLTDHLGKEFYSFLFLSFLFSLGSFSDGFLILKAQETGISLLSIFGLLALLTLTSTLVALPAGSFSDHHERKKVLVFGWFIFALSYFGFGSIDTPAFLVPFFVIYGIYYGMTQGVAKAIVSDLVPQLHQGLAFGLYNMTVGLALFPASLMAGFLWQRFSSTTAFYFGGTLAVLAAFGLLLKILWKK